MYFDELEIYNEQEDIIVNRVIQTRDAKKRRKRVMEHFKCNHSTTVLVKKPIRGGNYQIKPQCLVCGKALGNHPVKRNKIHYELPLYDPAIEEKHQAQMREALIRANAEHPGDFVELYPKYLQTTTWKKKRDMAMQRDNYTCQGCLTEPATCVHHLTYERVGEELLLDLVSLCYLCHEKIHDR